jgi:DNA-binding sugar fermentation-stimulating protein
MKQLILITAMLVAMVTKMAAQEKKAVEITSSQIQSSQVQQETHQFEIVANEEVNVNLKFDLKLEDKLNVLVTDNQNRVVFTKTLNKAGRNKVKFAMEENEKYTVLVNGNVQSNLIVSVVEY